MKKTHLIITLITLAVAAPLAKCYAQTATEVLDKTVAIVDNKKGVQASFTLSGKKYGQISGTIDIKGKKFHAVTPQVVIWYDGATQWTYLKKNDEVNISTPSGDELQAMNLYTFISMYKKGYATSMKKQDGDYVITLKAPSANHKISQAVITIPMKTYLPSKIMILKDSDWTTVTISNFKTAALNDDSFRFNSKDYPTAEVIDLR